MSEESKQFLDKLKEYNKTLTKGIYVPSLEREVKFSTLTAKHQKDIIHATLDNPIMNLLFQEKVYGIVKELCQEPEIVDTFTVFDKDAILIQMRYHFVSKEYEDKDFTKCVEYIREIKEDFTPVVEPYGGIVVQYQIPNMRSERKIYREYTKFKKIDISTRDEDSIRAIVTDAYIIELMKYINKIQIKEMDVVLDFNNHTFEENSKVIDYVGKDICDATHLFIVERQKKYKDMYWIDDNTEIEINPSLFS
jgi:hypothetical protein